MFNFCIKADRHLGASLEEQLEVCSRLLINNIEIDAEIDGTSLESLSGSQVECVRNLLIKTNKEVVLLDCDFTGFNPERINLLLRKAHLLGVENIAVAQWGQDRSTDLESLENLLMELLPIANSYGIGVTIENKRASCTSSEEALAKLFKKCGDIKPSLVFNPQEFAAEKKHPFFHVFYNSRLKPAIRFLRANDGLFIDGRPALPAEGNAEIKELASALLARSYRGYFSFHPYLPGMDAEQYSVVIERFKKLLMEM
jgi:sugar phosphate isomerase/epimerase